MRSRLVPALLMLCLTAACGCRPRAEAGGGPETGATSRPAPLPAPTGAPETVDAAPAAPCSALRPLLGLVIRTQADDDAAQAAVTRCVESRTLEGLTRAEVEALLGPGQPTAGAFDSFGVQVDDVFYEVGRFETPRPGGVPNLVLDFDAAGRCTRALSIHTM